MCALCTGFPTYDVSVADAPFLLCMKESCVCMCLEKVDLCENICCLCERTPAWAVSAMSHHSWNVMNFDLRCQSTVTPTHI